VKINVVHAFRTTVKRRVGPKLVSSRSDILNTGEIIMGVSATENLILDLLEWLAKADRSYEEVMDAWRTSCPRLPVWEDANDRGLVRQEQVQGRCVVKVTSSGLALLEQRRLQKPLTPSVV
jgi:hypothetical protein